MTAVLNIASYADLLSPQAVRSQAARVTEHVRAGDGVFAINDDALEACAQHVVDVTLRQYPNLKIPYHSRWRHFAARGAVELETRLLEHLTTLQPADAAAAGFDLVIPSVLLDAGAGPDWAFRAPDSTNPIGRSEGLGLASLDMFLSGAFSNDGSPRTDGEALASITVEHLADGFQVDETNPLVGIDGRLAILQSLGSSMLSNTTMFPTGRPGDLVVHLLAKHPTVVPASAILAVVLEALGPIWPQRLEIDTDGVLLGDAWHYAPFGDGPASIVPFHKLSQWLTYSLAETLERSGIAVAALDELTGLPEYRNGGLLLETGVLSLRDSALASQKHRPESQLIVEWRALTITLLDEVAALVRKLLDRPDMLLAEILEGGTWAAGRVLAFERNPAGSPPLHLDSDGTIF